MAKPIHMMIRVLDGLTPNPIKKFHRDGALTARFFLFTDPDGYRIEVLRRRGRDR